MAEQKPKIEVMFSSQFPEAARKDIQNLLESKFDLDISNKVHVLKNDNVWIVLLLTFFGTSFSIFLKEFLKESGKLLAQKLFQSGKQAISQGHRVEYRIEIRNLGQQNILVGKDADEIYRKLIELNSEQNV